MIARMFFSASFSCQCCNNKYCSLFCLVSYQWTPEFTNSFLFMNVTLIFGAMDKEKEILLVFGNISKDLE